jgi:hypothetical protein
LGQAPNQDLAQFAVASSSGYAVVIVFRVLPRLVRNETQAIRQTSCETRRPGWAREASPGI